ncbi:TPA: hypothetical protein ACH3X3_003871 [Trebouxia sp. C0006]
MGKVHSWQEGLKRLLTAAQALLPLRWETEEGTAAWLMQVRVCKIGYPRTGLWFKRGSLVDASLSVQEWRM